MSRLIDLAESLLNGGKPAEPTVLIEGVGRKVQSLKDFKNEAQDLADNITSDGKVVYKTKQVGSGDKKWHQTQSHIRNMNTGDSHIYGVFNHKDGTGDEGHGHHLTHDELDEETINELSKKTLTSYVTNSVKDQFNAAFDGDDKRISKRAKGEEVATKKLVKTNEEAKSLVELSIKTLGSYKKKAIRDIDNESMVRDHTSRMNAETGKDGTADRAKSDKKIGNRLDGIKKVSEEAEPLDELSTKTLGNYIKKASADKDQIAKPKVGLEKWAKESGLRSPKNSMTGGKNGVKYKDLERKDANRTKGIGTAVDKLTNEEVEELDELSRKTVGNYYDQASKGGHPEHMDAPQSKKDARYKSLNTAYNKMAQNRHANVNATYDAPKKKGIVAKAISKVMGEENIQTEETEKMTDTPRRIQEEVSGLQERINSNTRKMKILNMRDQMASPQKRKLAEQINEDTMRIDELSKKTLGTYIKSSSNTMRGAEGEKQKATTDLGAAHKRPEDKYKNADIKDANNKVLQASKDITKRWKGITKATDKLTGQAKVNANEEVETLVELSRKTLGNYTKKAQADVDSKVAMKVNLNKMNDGGKNSDALDSMADKAINKAANRQHDIGRANSKIKGKGHEDEDGYVYKTKVKANEEVEELDEISAETKASYMKKAGAEIDKHYDKSKTDERSGYKYYGRKNTMRKINNEEVETIEEAKKTPVAADWRKLAADEAQASQKVRTKHHGEMKKIYQTEFPKILKKHGYELYGSSSSGNTGMYTKYDSEKDAVHSVKLNHNHPYAMMHSTHSNDHKSFEAPIHMDKDKHEEAKKTHPVKFEAALISHGENPYHGRTYESTDFVVNDDDYIIEHDDLGLGNIIEETDDYVEVMFESGIFKLDK